MGTGLGRFLKPSAMRFTKWLGESFGLQIVDAEAFPLDFDKDDVEIVRAVQPYTMTSRERIYALLNAVRYIVQNDIPGDIVECGVWKGGSVMAAAMELLRLGRTDRRFFLYDTFQGMPEPTAIDIDLKRGKSAVGSFEQWKDNEGGSSWCFAPLDDVKETLSTVGYDMTRMFLVKGKVEDTIPANAPATIALLRLDTDFYESTLHELTHLFPRLSHRGVLIVDDYGQWQGARQAVDQYVMENNLGILLNRIDYTGRIGVKS